MPLRFSKVGVLCRRMTSLSSRVQVIVRKEVLSLNDNRDLTKHFRKSNINANFKREKIRTIYLQVKNKMHLEWNRKCYLSSQH